MKFGLARLDCFGWCSKSAALSFPAGPALPPTQREAPSHSCAPRKALHTLVLEPTPKSAKTSSEMKKMMCEVPKRLSSIALRKSRAGEGSAQKQEVESNNLGGSREC